MFDSKILLPTSVVGVSTPAEVATHVRDIESRAANYVSKKSQELKIVKFKQSLQSPPSAATGDVAFAHTDICLEDGREVSCAGYASAAHYQTNSPELLCSLAVADSTVKAISLVENLPGPCRTVHDVPASPVQGGADVSVPAPGKKEYRHRHDKKISKSQFDCLTKMALDKDLNPHTIATNLKDKPVRELSSADAHDVIQWLYAHK
jgi:hypothetical protein